jgi:DNA-binding transcriptional regulator YiaG
MNEPGLLMDQEEWGLRVLRLRDKLGLTQDQLSERLGFGRGTIPGWELRRTRPYSREAEIFLTFAAEIEAAESEPVS